MINFTEWREISRNTVVEICAPKTMEPYCCWSELTSRYGVFKRARNLPLFHPYFINYGGNKEQYFNVLNTMGMGDHGESPSDYHYNVMTMDFAVDIPHPPYHPLSLLTPRSAFKAIVRGEGTRVVFDEMFSYFNMMFNAYCENNYCRLFSKQHVKEKLFRKHII